MLYQYVDGKVTELYDNGYDKNIIYSPNQAGMPPLVEAGVPFKIVGNDKFWTFIIDPAVSEGLLLTVYHHPFLHKHAYAVSVDGPHFTQMYVTPQLSTVCETYFDNERTSKISIPPTAPNGPISDLFNPWVIIHWNRQRVCEYYDAATGRRCSTEKSLRNALRSHNTTEGIFRTTILPHVEEGLVLIKCTHDYVDHVNNKLISDVKWHLEVGVGIVSAIQSRDKLFVVVRKFDTLNLVILGQEETMKH